VNPGARFAPLVSNVLPGRTALRAQTIASGLNQGCGFGWIVRLLAASLPHFWHQNANSDRCGRQTASMV